MRRLLVMGALGAVTVAVLFGAFFERGKFGAAWQIRSVMASSTGNLVLDPLGYPGGGCPLSPAFTFCDQNPGTSSLPINFILSAKNAVTGATYKLAAVPGHASSFSAGDFTITGNTCGSSLAAQTPCTISVAFTPLPASTGYREAALTVTDSTMGDSAIINVSGRASALALAFNSPMTCAPPGLPAGPVFTFCDEALHVASPVETFTLTAGSAVTGLNVSLAAIPNLTANFASADYIVTNGCGAALAAGAGCTVGIQFDPTVTGLRAAVLTATDTGGDSTSFYLAGSTTSGLGIAGQLIPACSPGGSFEFCNTPTGGSFTPSAFTLRNTSGVQLTGVVIPTASATGDFKVTGTSCLSVLPAGGSCGVDVAFTPANTGLQFDSLTVTDAAGDVRSVILAGTGDNYTMALASAQPIEVSVVPGSTVAVAAVLTPDNVFGQDGEKVTFSCPPTAELPINTSCAVTPCPASITPGTPANITVTIVTSSKTVQAPLPSGGCSSYGPPPESALVGPMAEREIRGPDAWPLSSALLLGLLAAAALGVRVAGWRRRKSSVIFAAAAMLALVLAGCHHGGAGVTSATPLGVSSINIQGIATDASGNTLNTSRIIQGTQGTGFLLDVIANAGTGGGTGPFDARRAQ